MKHVKRLASLLLALTLVFALAATAGAATVTVPGGILKGHSFTAYQVFSGRYEDDVLSDVQWGNGVNSVSFLDALKSLTIGDQAESLFKDCTDAKAVADVLSANNSNTALANAVAKLAYAHKSGNGTELNTGENTMADGYYLVVDTTKSVAQGSAYNASLLQVVGNINIQVKTAVPTVEKKVLEDDKYNQDGGYGTGYNDVADYNIGDAVSFHLIGLVPDMSRYDTYKYIFHDTLSNGLTLHESSIKVYVASNAAGTDRAEIGGWTKEVEGQSFTVSFSNIKSVSGVSRDKYIIVEYTATLNANAVVGLDGNPNTVYLEYSNKPDQSGSGDNNTGNTPEDKAIVFTYELDATKVDGQDNTKKLGGAEFKLHNKDNKWATVDASGKVTGWADAEEGGSTLTSDAGGLFKVIGLDDGTYYLKETKAPAGYNLLANEIELQIIAATANDQDWNGTANDALTALQIKIGNTTTDGNVNDGTVAATVVNNAGSTLPETGGMGTTIFYVLGGILALTAIVLLVTKKRMNSAE